MFEYLWFYGLILVTFLFLWSWNRRLKGDLELIESLDSQDEKRTIQLGLIINLLAAIFVSLTLALVLIVKGLHSQGNLL
jgi:hypothetical protein